MSLFAVILWCRRVNRSDLKMKIFWPSQPLSAMAEQFGVRSFSGLTDCIILHKLSWRNGPAKERGKKRSFSYWRFSYLVACYTIKMIQKYFLKDKFFKGKNLNIFVVATYSKSSVLNVNRVSYMKICIKKSSILLSVDHPGPGQWCNGGSIRFYFWCCWL